REQGARASEPRGDVARGDLTLAGGGGEAEGVGGLALVEVEGVAHRERGGVGGDLLVADRRDEPGGGAGRRGGGGRGGSRRGRASSATTRQRRHEEQEA